MKLSIVVPVYNEEKVIEKCIKGNSFLSEYENVEVIYVDNGSTDSTNEILSEYDYYRIYKKEDCNVGGVRNFGAEMAHGEVLLFIDSDCVVKKEMIDYILNNLEEFKSNNVYGGGILMPENPTWVEEAWLLDKENNGTSPRKLIGASIVISKSNFTKIEGFSCNMTSGEDSDFNDRIIELGLNVTISKEFSVIHHGNAKTMKSFFNRISWHSENYISNGWTSFRDPMFVFCIIFTVYFLLIFVLEYTILSLLLFFLGLLAFPMFLTVRRILKSSVNSVLTITIFTAFILDCIYICAKTVAIWRSLIMLLMKKNKRKRVKI